MSLTLAGCSGRSSPAPDDDFAFRGDIEGHDDDDESRNPDPSGPASDDVVPIASLCRLSIGETTFLEMQEILGLPQKSIPGTRLVYDWGKTEGRSIDESVEYLHLEFTFDPDERLEHAGGQGSSVADCIKAWESREWNLLQHRKSSVTNTASAQLQNPLDYSPLPTSDALCTLTPGVMRVLNGSDFGANGPLPLFTARDFASRAEVREYRFGDLQSENVSSIYLYFRHDALEEIVSYNLPFTPSCWQ